jgi:hypothetical protein
MSVRVTGSDKRLSVAMPAEGQTWKRVGDSMVGADLGGGGVVNGENPGGVIIDCPDSLTLISNGENEGSVLIEATAGGISLHTGNGQPIELQSDPALPIKEFGGTGAPRCAPIANATDEASAVISLNALLAYLRLRGTLQT